jgi:glycine betaine/choline ABC-type transport system substrate-binding protein
MKFDSKTKTALLLLLVLVIAGGVMWYMSTPSDERRLTVAGKSHTEAILTSEILAQLLEQAGFTVERIFDLSSAMTFEAVRSGEADLYPEYTGSMLMAYLRQDIPPGTSPQETLRMAQEGALHEFDLVMLGSWGFNNTYHNAIRSDFAALHGIVTTSDLIPFAPNMVYGAEHAFYDRMDGFHNMIAHYGLTFARTVSIDVGLKRISMATGEIDITNVYTTDGWLAGADLTVLEDDLNFFPSYNKTVVIRRPVLERFPELEDIFAPLEGIATEADMIYYNNLIDSGAMSLRDTAAHFIRNKNLVR